MKNPRFNTALILTFALLIAGATVFGQKADKEISKEYKITSGYTLGIENKYGSIDVVNWDKDELTVVVKIETESISQSRAEDLLEKVDISIDEQKSAVYFETEIQSNSMNGKNNIKVSYTVNAPAYINVDLEQNYGNIFIQEISGKAMLELNYADLEAGSIYRTGEENWNELEVAYGSASIEKTGALSVELKYGALSIGSSNELSIESAYSKLTLGEVNSLEFESKYDKLNIEKLNAYLSIESAYTPVNIELITDSFTGLEAEMSYGNLKGKFEHETAFHIVAEASYGSINIPDGNYRSEKQNNRQKVEGDVGNNPKAEVNVSIRYGSLNLK